MSRFRQGFYTMKIIESIKSWLGSSQAVQTESAAPVAEEVTFESEIKRWFADKGDHTHRMTYPLTEGSVVFDLGGYVGDFADKINQKYGCQVFLFEPSEQYFAQCEARFKDNPKIKCFNFALSSFSGRAQLSESGDASSILDQLVADADDTEAVEVRAFKDVFDELGVETVDLIKINIEGGEFDILPHLIDNNLITRFKNIQVQFHNFVADATARRERIRADLDCTHTETWCYEFVWENWRLK